MQTDIFPLGYVLAGYFFLPRTFCMKFFLVDRLVKTHHHKSNYKGSVKESLKKSISFYLLESFRLTFIL